MGHPIPEGQNTITPHLVVRGASEAIEFYVQAFGAEEISRMPMPAPDGTMKVGHAALQIGDSKVFLCDEFPNYGVFGPGESSPVTIHLAVTDADASFARAVDAGATVTMPLMNMFWGDRYGKVVDPFGHHWSIGEHLEDLTPAQMMANMPSLATASCD